MNVRSLVSAWTLVVMSLLYFLVGIIDRDSALELLPSYVLVAGVLLGTHVFYSRRERDPHA